MTWVAIVGGLIVLGLSIIITLALIANHMTP